MRPKSIVIGIIIIIVGFLGMRILGLDKKKQGKREKKQIIRIVRTKVVSYAELRANIEAMGRVSSFENVSLTPEVSGKVLSNSFLLRKGKNFERGDILLRIDSRQARNLLRVLQSDLLNALALLLPELKADIPDAFTKWETFFVHIKNDELPIIPTIENSREKLYLSRYNIFKLYFLAENQKILLNKYHLYAPFSGTVAEAFIVPDDMARVGSPLASLVRTDRLEVEFSLSLTDIEQVGLGAHVLISVDGLENDISSTIDRISSVVDPTMQTVSVFVVLKNRTSRELKCGMFVSSIVKGKKIEHATVLPRNALVDKDHFYIIQNGELTLALVDIAFIDASSVYITGGIKEGVHVVIEPLQDAVLGMRIKSESMEIK